MHSSFIIYCLYKNFMGKEGRNILFITFLENQLGDRGAGSYNICCMPILQFLTYWSLILIKINVISGVVI